MNVSETQCEYSRNPVGIDSSAPRLSWTTEAKGRGLAQTAYQIIISSSYELAKREIGDAWDSGKIESDECVNIAVPGSNLASSGKKYWWQVRVWDQSSAASEYSEISTLEFGLLDPWDWEGKWIGGANLLRGTFSIASNSIRSARAYVAGLGFYELSVNGAKVGDCVLSPAWTDYEKRILYDTFDVAQFLRTGKNAVGISLGTGRYKPAKESDLTKSGYGPVKAILQLNIEYDDGTKITFFTHPTTWRCADGPVISSDLFIGEKYDARLEKIGWDTPGYEEQGEGFRACELMEPPNGALVSSATLPPIRVVGEMIAREIFSPSPGVFVYDFGQNFSGWVKLSLSGPAGTEVKLRYAELISEKHQLNQRTNEWAESTDTYVMKGDGIEEYEPRFTYHGFRYVELSGFPGTPGIQTLRGKIVHSDVQSTGGFSCSNGLINRIHQNVRWTQLSNLMGIPTDCPQRNERMGWLGDAYMASEEAMLNFWMPGFFEKWLTDIKDAQTPDGSVQGVAPAYWTRNPSDPVWGMAYIMIPYELFSYYGDRGVLETHYDSMKSYLEYLSSKQSSGYLVALNLNGDYCAPMHIRPQETPGELISSWAYFTCALTLSKIAQILNKKGDSEKFTALASNIRNAFNAKFLKKRWDRGKDFEMVSYGESQTCNILPLVAGMVPDGNISEVLQSLLLNISRHHDDHLDTGIVGTKFLFDVLCQHNQRDIAFEIATKSSYPGYGYTIREGATTLWERWEHVTSSVLSSHNHIMFGSIGAWFYKFLVGINPDSDCSGFKHFVVKPAVPENLEYASGSLQTVRGLIFVEWRKSAEEFVLKVQVPANARCTVNIPKLHFPKDALRLTESNAIIFNRGIKGPLPEEISDLKEDDFYVVCEIGSGSYTFTLGKAP